MEQQIRDFYYRTGRYPTCVDFAHEKTLPSIVGLKKKYKNKRLDVIMSEIFGIKTYEELLLDFFDNRSTVYFKANDIIRGTGINVQTFARWLSIVKFENYDITLYRKPGKGGVYCATRRF